ncbi:MAG TPA: hypothetical protein PLD27_08600 [bacterium]|nr:hypothetical protein [bacterium]HOL48570.1 hypothetical protein [bacterium]HPQ19243.1 hypothetical protein [bacterium]
MNNIIIDNLKEILKKIGLSDIMVKEMEQSKGFVTSGYNIIYEICGDENHTIILTIDKKDALTIAEKLLNEKLEEINKKALDHLIGLVQLIGKKIKLQLKKKYSNINSLKPYLIETKKFRCIDNIYNNYIIKFKEGKFLFKFY